MGTLRVHLRKYIFTFNSLNVKLYVLYFCV